MRTYSILLFYRESTAASVQQPAISQHSCVSTMEEFSLRDLCWGSFFVSFFTEFKRALQIFKRLIHKSEQFLY